MNISSSRQTAKTLYRLLHDGGCSEKDFVYELHEWRKQVEQKQRERCDTAFWARVMNRETAHDALSAAILYAKENKA